MAYQRRGYKGGTRQTTLVGDINNSATTIPGADLSSWSGLTTNGPGTATINQGQSDEETITFTGISGNNLTTVTRGAAGTTAQAHTSGATIDHTSSVTDFDEANAHIADTTLDHHTQYAKTDGSRTFTAGITVDGAASVFGRGAVGAGQYVQLSEDGTNTFVTAAGTTSNIAVVLRGKGTSGVVLQTPGGSAVVNVLDAGSGSALGLYGATPTTKQTVNGAKAGNAALASLMTALAAIGLVTDSTSA